MSEHRPTYTSAFADDVNAFISFKAQFGYESHTRNYVLYDFDQWCAEHNATKFDKETVEAWVRQRRERLTKKNQAWMSIIREMGRYLQVNGQLDAYVLSGKFKTIWERPIPYLLSEDEVEQFFDVADHFLPRYPWHWQAGCFYGLMCSCGLRPGEVRRLRRCDVRYETQEIDIINSKGGHSRRLAVSDEVMETIERCDAISNKRIGEDRPNLFISAKNSQVSIAMAARSFKLIWRKAGLPESQHGRMATPYAFRHYFAYTNIEHWAK